MTRKTYRTAQGKVVDLGALQLQNENVRAVGNMSVNARGDLIDGWNRPIDTKNKQVARQYNRQTTNVQDTPLNQPPVKTKAKKAPEVVIPTPPEDFQDDFVKEETTVDTPAVAPTGGGLAAAIARARQIRQDPIEPPPSTVAKPGLTRI